ncbi:helix-turn-helix domain-containing protein [Dyadobacter fanqingshengii]|uniref:Helix-turn-helix domain-containing protein n=1 Tax=Dyadobacter fanqingshengii TaxID=2906443 RepID=A0A9X1PD54_9BACT|nr:helix-turn-helix transcriptional regulator [Dyadobacter fanqingshengii]MCF0042791.1 helix-turn-helix domain-containing protein [Dyadobacter fanqingshengii]USJ35989.1 helix-turn-helix domain-containing protein [Dyadobacter fanqingshengii]
MAINTDNVRLVFGLKLKQLRLDKGMSLSELSQKSGLSISYINEIEKGKKYPKSDKIIALASAMDVDYDTLVSLKLTKRLEPISDLLSSNVLTELPLELFGIDPANLLEILSDAPAKISAFVGTLIEIARNYNMSIEKFYFSALRTYQEMHDNYFEDIELEAERFLIENNVEENQILNEKDLAEILRSRFNYSIENINEKANPEFSSVRSLTITNPNGNRLLMNNHLSSVQRAFIFGREIGYLYLGLKNRLHTTALVEAESFEQLLNNFKASYFSSAIIIKRSLLVPAVAAVFEQKMWKPQQLIDLIHRFNTTPESFCYRLSNILPRYFGINQIFFSRFNNFVGQNIFDMTKEMHISRKHYPHTVKDEHYCRRWVALTILNDLGDIIRRKEQPGILCKAQKSTYLDTRDEYLVISFALPMSPTPGLNVSVSMGIYLDAPTREKLQFLDDPFLVAREVNQTCERCSLFDCRERIAAPTILQKRHKNEELRKALKRMIN